MPGPASASAASLSRLSIEELAQIEVSSVSKRPEALADAPAAVYVITREQIRDSGVTTLPEALRLAPNLQVARISSSSYAITARGFNNSSANKLLVMIDGRSVYTPLHSGVFWDVQDVVLSDIERIEVVSGPGGTVWGANAVNGVINIVTRSARDTSGTLLAARAGSDLNGVTARQGWRLGDNAGVRAYAKLDRFDNTVKADGSPVADDWNRRQAGFRADWTADHAITVQGDAYSGTLKQPNNPDLSVAGGNLLGRWSRELGPGHGVQVQAYYDHTLREQPGFFRTELSTYDVDLQHHFNWGPRHEIIWGGGVRDWRDHTVGGPLLAFVPADSKLRLSNVFAQDTIALREQLKLTLGVKLEHNSYTGLEYQPNVRLAWKSSQSQLLWSSFSRAVRTPSRLDRDFQVFVSLGPPYNGMLLGGPSFVSERVTAYELGYRSQPWTRTTVSVSAFYNEYDRLRSVEPVAGGFVLGNGVAGRTHGLEAWSSTQVDDRWRVNAGLALLSESLHFQPGSADPGLPTAGANDPRYRFTLQSAWTLPRGWSVQLNGRAVGALPNPAVPSYTALDAHIAYAFGQDAEVSLTGFNLFDPRHAEFGAAPSRSEIPRSILLRLTWAL